MSWQVAGTYLCLKDVRGAFALSLEHFAAFIVSGSARVKDGQLTFLCQNGEPISYSLHLYDPRNHILIFRRPELTEVQEVPLGQS